MRAYERLLNYVKVYTTSEDEQEKVPSTDRQFDLGNPQFTGCAADSHDLICIQYFRSWNLMDSFFRHAVHAPEITSVCKGYPQVINIPSVSVKHKPSHLPQRSRRHGSLLQKRPPGA